MVEEPREEPESDEPSEVDMETLLREEEELYPRFRRGEIVEGTIVGFGRDGALVDIGSKSEGVIPNFEMQSLGPDPSAALAPGQTTLVYVLQPDTAEGQVLLSYDRARGEHGWQLLQQYHERGESFDGLVVGHNKGGLLVNVEGVSAFVPLSQLVAVRPERDDTSGRGLAEAVGQHLRLKVIEINRKRNRVILSERAALQEWRSLQRDKLLSELREGEIRRGRVTSIAGFGVFIDLGGADGLVHLSELSWERNKRPEDLFHVGDEVEVYVMKVDPETKKIALSTRRAKPDRWDEIVNSFGPNEVVLARVTKLMPFGAFAHVEGPVEGLIHVSELVDWRVGHPKEVVREGDILPLRIIRVEHERHRLGLSLRQARADGERMGFVFGEDGGVREVPPEIAERFADRVDAAVAAATPDAVAAEQAGEGPVESATDSDRAGRE